MAEWTQDAIDRMNYLISIGKYSAAEAASTLSREFGGHFSRNAVIGKCRRINLILTTRPVSVRLLLLVSVMTGVPFR